MPNPKLIRARRQVQKLAEGIGQVTQADRLFFERFPHRQHRLRIANRVEIEQHTNIIGAEMVLPSKQFFVVVRNVAPGVRLRLIIIGPHDADIDLSEQQARLIYEIHNNEKYREIEAQLREMISELRK
jgi:hypothetical protein